MCGLSMHTIQALYDISIALKTRIGCTAVCIVHSTLCESRCISMRMQCYFSHSVENISIIDRFADRPSLFLGRSPSFSTNFQFVRSKKMYPKQKQRNNYTTGHMTRRNGLILFLVEICVSFIRIDHCAGLNHSSILNGITSRNGNITKNYSQNLKQLIFIGYFVVGEGEGEKQHKL